MAINVITVSGNVGKDAILRVTPNGKHIATFSLPAKSGFGDKEKTSWLQCKLFGAMAEKLSQSILKGSKVAVTGEFVLEEWKKKRWNKSGCAYRSGERHRSSATPAGKQSAPTACESAATHRAIYSADSE